MSQPDERSPIERFLFSKIELWLVLLLLIVLFLGIMLFSWTLKNAVEADAEPEGFAAFAVALASVPDNLASLLESGVELDEEGNIVQRNPQIVAGDYERNLEIIDAGFEDDGYLMVSAYSAEDNINVIYLFDITRNEVLWRWAPQPEEIVASSERLSRLEREGRLDPIETRAAFRSQAPLLLSDGSLVVTSGEGSLSKWSPCGELIWANDRHFHHSIERWEDGFIVPIVMEEADAPLKNGLRDDGYALVGPDGEIVSETSILDILYENGHMATVLGRNIGTDPVHLNDAEIIGASDAYVEAGDIMLSSRHLSAVFVYRPSTGKIVWYEAGPWLAQHDLDYLGDGVFSLYGNDNSLALPAQQWPYGHSTIYTYDVKTRTIGKPYDSIFGELGIRDGSSSTHRVLRNGDAFVEQSTSGVMWRLSPEGARWRYVHRTADGIGAMQWSRYLYEDEVELEWIDETACPD